VQAAASPHAWIATVALDLSRSWWQRGRAARRARRHAGTPAAGIPEPAAGIPEPAAAGPVAAERVGDEPDPHEVEAVRAAVLALPAQQRAALLLRHYAGLPVDETAAALGCTAGAVKSLTHSAVNALRVALDDIDDMIELEEVLDG
jgi:RNA polymerase sigma factor (sigma-70 family)